MLGDAAARGPGETSLAEAFYCAGGDHGGSAVSWRVCSSFSLVVSFEREDRPFGIMVILRKINEGSLLV